MKHRILCLAALLLTAALLLYRIPAITGDILPGTHPPDRTLLRIWTLSSIGGGQAWLKQVLKRYEQAHPGVMTYLRQASADELYAPGAVLPDILLYMPGDLTGVALLQPLSDDLPVEASLLACGRCGDRQYALPLCWGAYVMAISSSLEPEAAVTPAPTTLLGKPAPTPEQPQAASTPAYPLQAAMQADRPLLCSSGAACITLRMLLPEELPPMPDNLPEQPQVYAQYLAGGCGSAVLTTGQATALASAVSSGKAQAYRILTPASIVTDQVWLGSITASADHSAAGLLAWLISPDMQKLLYSQQLQPARRHLRLYAADWPAAIASAAQHSLTAVNAYLPLEQAAQCCRQVLQAHITPEEAARQLCE